jgi:hypothetical protein
VAGEPGGKRAASLPVHANGPDAVTAPTDVSQHQPSDNWDWIIAHPEVLEQHRGEYVAIWEQRVVLHGTDPRALHDALRQSPYWEKPLLVFRVPTREEVDGILVL